MSYDLIDREDGLALSQMANRYGIGVLVAVLATEADGRGDHGTAKALRGAGVTSCGWKEPDVEAHIRQQEAMHNEQIDTEEAERDGGMAAACPVCDVGPGEPCIGWRHAAA